MFKSRSRTTRFRPLIGLLALLCVSRTGFTAERLDAVKARGVLEVGTTGDYKPFTFRQPDGTYVGADIDMARDLAAKLGVRLVLVPTTWATLRADFLSGRFDVAMGGVSITPARMQDGFFSLPVLTDGKRPIARCADADRFTSLAAIDRPDVRVIVNAGASNEQFARANFPHAQLRVQADNVTVFDEIAQSRADVMVTDGVEVDHQAVLDKALCATHVQAAFTQSAKAYWLQKDVDLQAAVDRWLQEAIASGRWQQIFDAARAVP